MIITYHGSEFIKAQAGEVVIAFNPIGKQSTYKQSRFGSDIALVSLNHHDFDGVEQLTYKEKGPFVISGPGEYEVKGIFIKGFPTAANYAGKERVNTVYSIKFDDINVCHLGALRSVDALTSEIREKIGDVDILFVPIAGGDVLDPSEASKAAVMLAPKIVIPVHFDTSSKKQLEAFLKEIGNDVTPVDKLTLKKKDLLDKEGEVVVLNSLA